MSCDEFCERVKLYQNTMYALAFSILRNEEDAADAISESIVKAYSNLSQLKTPHSFRAWLLTIVRNTCLEMLRQNPQALTLEEQYDLAAPYHDDVSTKLVLRDAVEHLKQPYRTVVYLFYYEQLPILEISKITGSSPIAVKKQLSRARAMLQKSLSKEDFF